MTELPVVVYEWLTTPQYYLLFQILPEATVVPAGMDDSVDHIIEQIPVNTAAFVFHLNCTMTGRFPRCRTDLIAALQRGGTTVINAGATDISKRAIQQRCRSLGLPSTLAAAAGDPDETIIVKTDLNFAGCSEWALSEEERAFLGMKGSTLIWRPSQYMILPRSRVEPAWWTDQSLICERYVSNRFDRCYRSYWFLDRLVVCQLMNPEPIKKMDGSLVERVWELSVAGGAPDCPQPLVRDLAAFIRDFSLDFGTVDVMEDDRGRFYIVDVNTTPAYNCPVPGLVEYLRQERMPMRRRHYV